MRGLAGGAASDGPAPPEAVAAAPEDTSHPPGIGTRAVAGRLAFAGAVVMLLVGPRLSGALGQRCAVMATSFVALVVEALPFLLAGAVIAAAARGGRAAWLAGFAVRHPRLAAALAPLTGGLLPLCDCGLVPIARRLRDAGMPAGALN